MDAPKTHEPHRPGFDVASSTLRWIKANRHDAG